MEANWIEVSLHLPPKNQWVIGYGFDPYSPGEKDYFIVRYEVRHTHIRRNDKLFIEKGWYYQFAGFEPLESILAWKPFKLYTE